MLDGSKNSFFGKFDLGKIRAIKKSPTYIKKYSIELLPPLSWKVAQLSTARPFFLHDYRDFEIWLGPIADGSLSFVIMEWTSKGEAGSKDKLRFSEHRRSLDLLSTSSS